MNVTEQSVMLSSYASGEILSTRRKADNGRPKGDVIGKPSFPKRGTKAQKKKRQGKKPIPRDSFQVDRNILVTETEKDFLHAERKWNQFKFKTTADQPVVPTTIENILRENAIYHKIMGRWVKNWNWKTNLSSKIG